MPLRLFSLTRFRRCVCLTLLIVLTAGMAGLPTFGPTPAKGGRFPCEDCPCGCSTAEFCWDKCCCHTDEEKVQWAAKNNVTPPAFLFARLAKSECPDDSTLLASSSSSAGKCCCCSTKPTRRDDKQAESQEVESGYRIVRLEDAARCRGIELVWSLLSQIVVDASRGCVALRQPPLPSWILLNDERCGSLSLGPEPPVP